MAGSCPIPQQDDVVLTTLVPFESVVERGCTETEEQDGARGGAGRDVGAGGGHACRLAEAGGAERRRESALEGGVEKETLLTMIVGVCGTAQGVDIVPCNLETGPGKVVCEGEERDGGWGGKGGRAGGVGWKRGQQGTYRRASRRSTVDESRDSASSET